MQSEDPISDKVQKQIAAHYHFIRQFWGTAGLEDKQAEAYAGLGKLTDLEYMRAMQSINKAVLNPVFFTSFFGTLILLPLSAWMCYRDGGADTVFYFLLASSIIYVVGVFLITGMGTVPLNESLARINLSIASPNDL